MKRAYAAGLVLSAFLTLTAFSSRAAAVEVLDAKPFPEAAAPRSAPDFSIAPANVFSALSPQLLAVPDAALKTAPARVVIIRHAEKPASGDGLSARGQERARALVGFFKTNREMTRYGLPAAIYAMKPKADGAAARPLETVMPLAQSLGISVNADYRKEDVSAMAQDVMTQPAHAGKMVLIAWEHHWIPAIARAFGVANAPETWPSGVFDRAWIIDFDGGKPVSFQDVPQRLLSGDSAE